MATLTGTLRLKDLSRTTRISAGAQAIPSASVAVTESIRYLKDSVVATAVAREAAPTIPGFETAVRLKQALTRPATRTRTAAQDLEEERLNAVTHGLGLAISAAAFVYLLMTVTVAGSWLRIASCAVYGASLMAMYAASTSLHIAEALKVRGRFQMADHVAIYLLIAGTYTPFLAAMQSSVGLVLLGCVWALAAIGISIKVKYADCLEETSPLPYVGLGWLVVAAVKPLLTVVPMTGIGLLVAGGVSYSAGVIFYCRDDKRYFHAIWHLFVMAGTAFHFLAVLLYVAT